jgi:outer membrane protein OmpA-like peptidoglycan-associated protein
MKLALSLWICTASAALTLSGCLTPRAHPAPSPAIQDLRARAARTHAPTAAETCAALPAPAPMVEAPFAFDQGTLDDEAREVLDGVVRQLACHRELNVVLTGEGERHQTPADQRKLAQQRIAAVRDYLTQKNALTGRSVVIADVGAAPPPTAANSIQLQARDRGW